MPTRPEWQGLCSVEDCRSSLPHADTATIEAAIAWERSRAHPRHSLIQLCERDLRRRAREEKAS